MVQLRETVTRVQQEGKYMYPSVTHLKSEGGEIRQ